jgi:hypothetical protein
MSVHRFISIVACCTVCFHLSASPTDAAPWCEKPKLAARSRNPSAEGKEPVAKSKRPFSKGKDAIQKQKPRLPSPSDVSHYSKYEGHAMECSPEDEARGGNKKIVVVINEQRGYRYEGERQIGAPFYLLSGALSTPTKPGKYHIRLKKIHHENADGSAMPFSQFFSHNYDREMVGFHAGNTANNWKQARQYRELSAKGKSSDCNEYGSRGCVRVSREFARALFKWTTLCTVVEVVMDRPRL